MRKLCILFICLMLTGCSTVDIDSQIYPLNMGIDTLPDGSIRTTLHLPLSQTLDTLSLSPKDDAYRTESEKVAASMNIGSFTLASATATTWPQTIKLLRSTMPYMLNLTHLKYIIISGETAFRGDFIDLLNDIILSGDTQGASQMIVCQSEALDFMRKQRMLLGVALSTLENASFNARYHFGLIPSGNLSGIFQRMHGIYDDGIAILGGINDFAEPKIPPVTQSTDVLAGQANRVSSNEVELLGGVVFDNHSAKMMLTGFEMQIVHMIRGEFSYMIYGANGMDVELRAEDPVRITVDSRAAQPIIDIILPLSVIKQDVDPPSVDALSGSLTESIFRVISDCQSHSVDPFGFAERAATGFADFASWRAYNWREAFPSAQIRLNLHLTVKDM